MLTWTRYKDITTTTMWKLLTLSTKLTIVDNLKRLELKCSVETKKQQQRIWHLLTFGRYWQWLIMPTTLKIVDSVKLTCSKKTVHLKQRKKHERDQENKSLIKKINAILTSVASLFSLISALFSSRKMRLVAEPTYLYIFVNTFFPPI